MIFLKNEMENCLLFWKRFCCFALLKTEKTPQKEIAKAEKIREEYFRRKK